MSENEYVQPPRREKQENYVQPPHRRRSEDYVQPPHRRRNEDYVQPPSQQTYTTSQDYSEATEPYQGYFDTPRVGITFYLNGYLFIMLALIFTSEDPLFVKGILTAYTLWSNYTYSWYADYRRFINGMFTWLFLPFQGVKAASASSSLVNFQKAHVSNGFLGGYNVTTTTDFSKHILFFVIVTIVVEAIKFLITIPIAFITIFTHRSTIKKYTLAASNSQF